MTYKTASIGEVCDLVNGRAFKPSEWSNNGLPIVRIQNLNDHSKEFNYTTVKVPGKYYIDDGELLFSWSGTPGTSFGAFFWDRGKALLNQHIFKVLPDPDILIKAYFRYALNSILWQVISQSHGGVGLQHITKKKLEALTIPIPPLEEQRRIAAILDKADEIRKKRREAIALADEYLRSAFLDMFGDPVTNPKGWEVKKLGDVLESIGSGTSPVCETSEAKPDEWGVLKLGAVTYCTYNQDENKAVKNGYKPKANIEVNAGDVLFTRKNTYDLVGATAYVWETRPKLALPDLIFRLNLSDNSKMLPIFLWQMMIRQGMRSRIKALANGAAGSMPNISKSRLKTLEVIRPPLKLQEKFVEFVNRHRGHLSHQNEYYSESDNLFNSLTQRAFRGEL